MKKNKGFRVLRGKKGYSGWDYLHKDPFNTREEAQAFLDNFNPDTYKGCSWSASGAPPYDYIIIDVAEQEARAKAHAAERRNKEKEDKKRRLEIKAIADRFEKDGNFKNDDEFLDAWWNFCLKQNGIESPQGTILFLQG